MGIRSMVCHVRWVEDEDDDEDEVEDDDDYAD
jgi:hypothetical protein